MFQNLIENYIKELQPKYYRTMKGTPELEEIILELNEASMNDWNMLQRGMVEEWLLSEESKKVQDRDSVVRMIWLQAEEIVRDGLRQMLAGESEEDEDEYF